MRRACFARDKLERDEIQFPFGAPSGFHLSSNQFIVTRTYSDKLYFFAICRDR